ncbi:DoxX family protein [Kitasatospora sp. NPDC090308]|uniref:DoxX family protein n=1 Tax=Kitasatospora sp. NPDC090308 TaxID=3364082 RepID=UPI0037F63C16
MSGAVEGVLLVGTVCCASANAVAVVAKLVRGPAGLGPAVPGLPGRTLAALGPAASVGPVLFSVGAVAAHVRAEVLHALGFPAVSLLSAAASVGHFGFG